MKNLDSKRSVVKFIARAVVASGTSTITNGIIRSNVQPGNIFQQISVGVASLVIGSMAESATSEHTAMRVDQLFDALNPAPQEPESDHLTDTIAT